MPTEARILLGDRAPKEASIHWGQKYPRLLLIVFDTAAVARINENKHATEDELKLPAKYAVRFHDAWDDDGIVAQVLLYGDKGNAAAVWFDGFNDLPFAVEALRVRFPNAKIPDQISGVIDWPFRREKLEPGATLIAPSAEPVF